jgi:hypothetical protein
MTLSRILFSVLALSVCLPAFGDKVKVFPNKKANMASYKSYSWIGVRLVTKTGIKDNDPEVAPLMEKAIDTEMTSRGFTKVPKGGDLEIGVLGRRDGSSTSEYMLNPGGYLGPYGAVIGVVNTYNNMGTLIFGFTDPKTKEFAWAAAFHFDLKKVKSVQDIPPVVDRSVREVFKKFPVKAGQ